MEFSGQVSNRIVAVAAGTTLALACFVVLSHNIGGSSTSTVALQGGWLDEGSYAVLCSIVDALIPKLDESDVEPERIQDELVAMLGAKAASLPIFASLFSEESKSHLQRGGLESEIPSLMALAVGQFALKKDRDELLLALKIMSTSLGCFVLTGYFQPFNLLSSAARRTAMGGLRDSPILQKRAIYHAMKRLVGFFLLSATSESNKTNPSWSALKYEPASTIHPSPIPPSSAPLFDLPISDEGEIECDVVIIGSGAGGGMMGYQLAKAGFTVLVVEKSGHYTAEAHFSKWREIDAMRNLYDRAGLVTSADSNIVILAGSSVGGGTTVNWSASFRTPDHLLKDWEGTAGSAFSPGGEFHKALDETERLLCVNTDKSFHQGPCNVHASEGFVVNKNNQLLHSGATQFGLNPQKIPRNVTGCTDCGSCMFGCNSRSKQSTWELMQRAINGGHAHTSSSNGKKHRSLHVLPDCDVQRVLLVQNRAVGVEALLQTYKTNENEPFARIPVGSPRHLKIRARVVCCSAGALHTPAVLLRSGFKNSKIGRHLALHPVLACAGVANSETGLYRGVGMGVVVGRCAGEQEALGIACTRQANDRSEHGVVVQTPPVHPGLMGIALPWRSGLGFKLSALLYPHLSLFIGISRDRSSMHNRITIDAQGRSVVHYELTQEDKPMLMAGLRAQMRLMFESGSDILFPMHETLPWFVRDQSQSREEQLAALNSYISIVDRAGCEKLKMLCFSAHQMGSCRMANSPSNGPVSPTGELWEAENLFVSDSSVFPTSLGVNPMITIEAMSVMISKKIVSRLEQLGVTPHSCNSTDW